MPDRKTLRDGSRIVRARPFDRRPDASPKRPVIGKFPDTEHGWKQAVKAEQRWYSVNRPNTQVTVAGLREQYLADHGARWDLLSTQRAEERTRAFCERYGTEAAESIKSETCRRWLNDHPSDRQALRAMWNWGVKAELLEVIPWDRLGATGSAKARRQDIIKQGRGALTEPELASFSTFGAELHGPWMGDMITFTGYSGLRQGEVFAARPEWVGGELLEVVQQYRSRVPADAPEADRWTPPKYGKTRELALLPEAAAVIDSSGTFLFTNPRDGTHWTASAFAYYWTAMAGAWSASADAPNWLRERVRLARADRQRGKRVATGAMTFHELRHTFATILLEDGVTSEHVALQLGDTVDQVHDTYGHPRTRVAAEHVLRARKAATERREPAPVTSLEDARKRRTATPGS